MKPFKLSKIYTANSDLTKKWFVFYYYQHPVSGELKRFKVKGGVNRYLEIETRMDAIEQLQHRINHDPLNGFNPFENNETTIKSNICKALDEAVEYKHTYVRKRSYQSSFQISEALKEWLYRVRLYDIQSN